ncbi:MAG: phage tail protein [Akkermansia sp.]|nr:phage tail protein [Akkermansia sp.]
MSTTTTGKNLNLTIEDLSGMEIELRPLEPGGGGWDIGGKLFRGELYDERTDEKVGDIECLVTDAGRVVCRFPGMGRGRYSFAVFVGSEDGNEAIFVDGYVGYSAPAATGGGFVDTVNRVVNVVVDGVRRIATYAHTSAAERAADRAEEALDDIGEQVARLDAVQEATDALRDGISTAVRINDSGRWQIGEVDSGVLAQGPPGQSGAEVQYHVIESEEYLPTDAEHCSSLHRYLATTVPTKASEDIYMGVMSGPDTHGVKINGTPYVVDLGRVEDLVAAINEDEECPVTARDKTEYGEFPPLQYTIELKAKEEGEAGNLITVEAVAPHMTVPYPTLQGGDDGGRLFMYVWADNAWAPLPLDASSIATTQSHGLVKLGLLGGSGDKVPVVEGLDGGLYCDRAPLATKLLAGMVKVAASMTSTTAVPLAKDAKDYADGAAADAAQNACDTLEGTLHTYIAEQIATALSTAINVPTGGMVTYWGDEVPDGWLECDGSEVLRADYPALFAVIGTAFGAPSSDTKFKLPDLRDRFVRYMGEDHDTLGEKEEPALPNITGSAGLIQNRSGQAQSSGALNYTRSTQSGTVGSMTSSQKAYCTLALDASDSSSVYKNGESEVKVKAIVGKAIIKY